MREAEKISALTKVAKEQSVVSIGKSKYRISSFAVHVRFCSTNERAPSKYKFNINPNTLTADYELWICGSAAVYYLMPVSLMQAIYQNPGTYTDKMHPEIRVVSVDVDSHAITYASGGVKTSINEYFGVTLNRM